MTVPFHVPYRTGREEAYVAEVLAGGPFAGNGPFTQRCQRWIETHLGAPHVLLTTSCTAAMELAALSLGIGAGDEVIVPSFTFPSTAAAFMRAGARIVFADVDPSTMALDVDDVAARITPATRAIVPIHYGGVGCDIARLQRLCEAQDILLVEDAAQALDASADGRPLGTFGRMAAFSFHETKNIHCGLGGALVLNRSSDFAHAENVWERGTNRQKMFRGLVDKYSWVALGGSFYPSELQAAFLFAQLEGLAHNTSARVASWEAYDARLAPLGRRAGFATPRVPAGYTINGHAYWIVLPDIATSDRLRESLRAQGITAHIHYVPLHSSPMGRELGWAPEDVPVTEDVAPRLLRMPMHAELTPGDVERVCDAVEAFFSAAG